MLEPRIRVDPKMLGLLTEMFLRKGFAEVECRFTKEKLPELTATISIVFICGQLFSVYLHQLIILVPTFPVSSMKKRRTRKSIVNGE